MKNFIIKAFGFLLVLVSILGLLGFFLELSDGTSSFSEDWGILILIVIIFGVGVSLLRINNVPIGNILLAHSINKNEKILDKIDKIENAIKTFDEQYDKEKSENIYIVDNINEECISNHQKKHPTLNSSEKPLLILNCKKSLLTKLFPFTGIMITNKNMYFATLKRSFVTGIIPFKEKPGSIPLEYIMSFQIGEHDTCFGSAYVGHDLMINGQVLGLVRLGNAITYDEKALEYINGLSKYLFEKGFLCEKPKQFSWQ